MSFGEETMLTTALVLVAPREVAKVDLATARRRIVFEVRNADVLRCQHSPLLKASMTGFAAHGGPFYFFQFEAWLHAEYRVWRVRTAARPDMLACYGIDKSLSLRDCLMPWRCLCAVGGRRAMPQPYCAVATTLRGGASSSASNHPRG